MAAAIAALIPQLIGAGSGVMGLIKGNQAQKWQHEALVNVLNKLAEANVFGRQGASDIYNWLAPQGQDLLNRGQLYMFGGPDDPGGAFGRYNEMLDALYGGISPERFRGQSLPEDFWGNLQGGAAKFDPGIESLYNILSRGGRTFDSEMLRDRLMDRASGLGAGDQFRDVGGEILGQRGRTNYAMNAQDRAIEMMNLFGRTPESGAGVGQALGLLGAEGRTPGLDRLSQMAEYLFGTQGLTPTGAEGESVALEGLSEGGENEVTRALAAIGLGKAGQDRLMPLEMAVGQAQEQAGAATQAAAEKAYRQALARGGGPGSVVASGVQNQALGDFATEAARNEAAAIAEALQRQQGLGLTEQGQGTQMAMGGGGLAAERLGKFGGLLSNLEDVASRRFGYGMSLAPSAEEIATKRYLGGFGALDQLLGGETQRALGYGGLGQGAGQLDIQRLLAGGGLMRDYFGTMDTGASNLLNLLGMENQYALGAGRTLGDFITGQGGLNRSAADIMLGGQRMGGQQISDFYDNLFKGQALYGANLDRGTDWFKSGFNIGGNLFNNLLNYSQGTFGPMGGLFGGQQGSQVPSMWQNLGQGAGQAGRGLYDVLFGGGGKSGGGGSTTDLSGYFQSWPGLGGS